MINTQEIEHYLEFLATPESHLLEKVRLDTYKEVLMPNMISGPVQGRFLSMMSKLVRPKYVLEIGTFTGYSALCLAEGITPGGVLCSIDINEELRDRVSAYLKESNFPIQFELHTGDAIQIIPTLHYSFDLVFIDADKQNYSHYYDMIIPLIQSGTLVLIDNTLWKGKVTNPSLVEKDKDTQALDSLNRKIAKDERVEQVIVPIRDGITLIRKK